VKYSPSPTNQAASVSKASANQASLETLVGAGLTASVGSGVGSGVTSAGVGAEVTRGASVGTTGRSVGLGDPPMPASPRPTLSTTRAMPTTVLIAPHSRRRPKPRRAAGLTAAGGTGAGGTPTAAAAIGVDGLGGASTGGGDHGSVTGSGSVP